MISTSRQEFHGYSNRRGERTTSVGSSMCRRYIANFTPDEVSWQRHVITMNIALLTEGAGVWTFRSPKL